MICRSLIAGAAAAALAACATPTPYQPASATEYGYSEQRIEADRFRVSFAGNTLTDRATVENFLLLRAAELTLQNGERYFRVVNRATEEESRQYATGVYPHFGFYTHYRFYDPFYGWYGYGSPHFNDVQIRESTRYEATAEIKFGAGGDPGADNVFDAQDVVNNLRGEALRPAV